MTLPSQHVGMEHLTKVNDSLDKVKSAIKEAKLLEQAGFPHLARTDELVAMRDKLQQFKSVYFPGH